MSESLIDKYIKMAENRDDFNCIDTNKFLLPDMSEMIQEDLMNEILDQYGKDNKVDKDNKENKDDEDKNSNAQAEKDKLDSAFYVETPFSLTPGYFAEKGAFVLKVQDLNKERCRKDKTAWDLNIYDGDTLDFSVNNIDDGNQSFSLFSYSGNLKYKNWKDFYKKINGSSNMQIRFLGMDAAEVPHFTIQPVLKEHVKDMVKEMTYKEMVNLKSRSKALIYEKCPYYDGKVHQRTDDEKVTVMDLGGEDKSKGYSEVITRFKDVKQMYMNSVEANGKQESDPFYKDADKYEFYVILGKEESQSNLIGDAYKAQAAVKQVIEKASEVMLVINANGITPKKVDSFTSNKTFNNIFYAPEVAEFIIDKWDQYYKDLPITNYGYTPVGLDTYQRCLGVVYAKYEGRWINVNKYVMTQTEMTNENPNFNDSPELQQIGAGISDSFNLWSYNTKNIQWLDSFTNLSKNSYQEKLELHKKLTNFDFTQNRDCALMIGDTLMLTPPESIRNVSQLAYERLPAMRSKGTMAKDKTNVEQLLEIDLYFYEEEGINGIPYTEKTPGGTVLQYYMNGLRSLLAQFKVAPFLPIENGYINDVLGIEAVTLQNISIQTVEGFPRLLKAVLTLQEFNYRMFMPDLPLEVNENENSISQAQPFFAKCFDWTLFRYYYQRAIKAGDDLYNIESKGGYGSYQYNLTFYQNKNSIGPFLFCGEYANKGEISFYIPDEDWLNNALQLKKQRDSTPNLTTEGSIDLSDNAKGMIEKLGKMAQSLQNVIKGENADWNNALNELIGTPLNNDEYKLKIKFMQNLTSNFGTSEAIDRDCNTWLYMETPNGDVTGSDFITTYVAPLKSALLKDINDASYVKDCSIKETMEKQDNILTVTWSFSVKINTDGITDEEWRDIREVLAKTDGKQPDEIFKDNDFKLTYKMSFLQNHWWQGIAELSKGTDIKSTFIHVESEDEKVLNTLIKGYDKDEKVDEEQTNKYNKEIDFYVKDYKNPANMPFVPYLENVLCKSMMANTSNSFTDVNIKAIEGKGPQYMGGQDTQLQLECITDDMAVVGAINALPTIASALGKKYRRILPAWPIKIHSDFTRLLGVSEVLIDMIDVSTVEGYPGVYSIIMRMTSVDRTQRQREAMRRLDVAPVGGKVGYNYDSDMGMKSYFALDNALAEAELYPDLDLPTLKDLAKLGYRFVKYSGQNRSFPDPDFYIVYNYPYTSLLIKKMVKDILTKNLLNPNGDEKAHTFNFKDMLGADISAKVEEYTGLAITEEKGNSVKYSEIIKNLQTNLRSKLTNNSKLTEEEKDDAIKTMELSAALNKITLSDIIDGWELKPGWKAPLADSHLNDSIANLKKEDNAYAKEILERRKQAIQLIDKILAKPIEYRDDKYRAHRKTGFSLFHSTTIDYKVVCQKAISNLFYDDEDGKQLIQLLCPTVSIAAGYGTMLDQVFGSGKFNDDFFKESNPLNYLVGFLFASGCALSGEREYNSKLDTKDWYPKQYVNSLNAPNIDDSDSVYKDYVLPYCVVDNIGGAPKISTTIENGIQNGTMFGAWRINKYSSTTTMTQMVQKEAKDIAYVSDNDSAYKEEIKPGFLDPYYNNVDDSSNAAYQYKKSLLLSPQSNAEAFLRNVLLYLRKLICDGLIISEVDIMMNDFDNITKQLTHGDTFTEEEKEELRNKDPYGEIGAFFDKQADNSDFNVALKELGFDKDGVNKLLDAIQKAAKRAFSARLAYPFLMAITENNTEIYDIISKRNYDSLNGMISYVENGSNLKESKPIVLKFLNALGGIDMLATDKDDKKDSVSPSQMVANSLMKDIYIKASEDPRAYLVHSFYDMLVNDKRGRLVRAFPTYYVVFIDEGRNIGSWKLHDNFYNMNSIASINVVKSRKIASDTCTIVMNNMFNSYTMDPDSTTTQQYVDIYGLRDVFDSIFSPKAYFEKEKAIRLRQTIPDTVVLTPGIRMHVRIGYGADGSKLPIVFNGKIAEIDVAEVAQIVAQGDGHELMNPLTALGEIEALSIDPAESTITWFKDLRGSFSKGGESPRDLLAKILTAKYGGWKKFVDYHTDGRWFNDNPFGISHFGDPKFAEVFEQGEIVQNLYEVSDESLLKGVNDFSSKASAKKVTPIINTSLADKTFWDLLHMCAKSGLNYIGAIRDFGFRSTVFLGKPNHYYAYAYDLVDGKVVEKRKPFQQFHYIDSYTDIVYNAIKASEAEMKTNAVGMWQASDFWWGREQATVGPIYLDMNIYPEYQKSMTVDTGLLASGNGGIDIPMINHFTEKWTTSVNDDKVNKELAWRITANSLRDSVKDMYQGDVCIIGDPSIKPHDRVYLHDTYEDMSGMFEVEAVIHNLSADTGFTTSIMADVITRHDDNQEIAVQSLMNVTGGVLGFAVGFPIAERLWAMAVHGKLATIIGKSSSMYGKTNKLAKIAKGFYEVPGMSNFLEKRPTLKSVFETLHVVPNINSINLEGYTDAIKQLSKIKVDKLTSYDDIAKALSYYSKLDISKYKDAIDKAYKDSKYGSIQANYSEKELKKAFDDIKKSKEELDKMFDLSKFNTKDFADEILKVTVDGTRLDKLTTVEIEKIITKWTAGEAANIDDIAKVLSNDEILKAIKEGTLKVDHIDDFVKDFKRLFEVTDKASDMTRFGAVAARLTGGTLTDDLIMAFKGVAKSNIASLIIDLVIEVTVMVMVNNAKEMFTRFLKSIQAVDVYPLKRWNKPLIAGMNGNKGSVYGYPVTDGYDSMQGMVMEFIEMFKKLDGGDGGHGLADWVANIFIDEGTYQKLKQKWLTSLNLDYADTDTNEEHLAQNALKDISAMYANNNQQGYSLLTLPRVKKQKLNDWETLKQYQVVNLTTSQVPTNPQVLDMRYPGSNVTISKAMYDNKFEISHASKADTSMNIPFESGVQTIPIKIEKNIISTPLVREELITILEYLVQHEKLKKKKIIFKSGLNINDVDGKWKSTGFEMILEMKWDSNFDDLIEVLEEYKKSSHLIKASDGFFEYQADDKNKKVAIIVLPPESNTAAAKRLQSTEQKKEEKDKKEESDK